MYRSAPIFVVDKSDKRNEYLYGLLVGGGYKARVWDAGASYTPNKKHVFLFAPSRAVSQEIADTLPKGSTVFCVFCTPKVVKYLEQNGVTLVKIFDDELLAVRNANLTAEGALAALINNTEVSLSGLRVLIIGGGRVGKATAKILQTVGCKVCIATRRKDEFAIAPLLSECAVKLRDIDGQLPEVDAVVNTVPARVLGADRLAMLREGCFVLDLASKPYGADIVAAREAGVNYLIYPSVPGKVAPKTAAAQMLERVFNNLKFIIEK